MDKEKRLEIIKRNVSEIITEPELRKLLDEKKQIVYHGFEPSGKGIHIGYLLGISKHIDFQKSGLKLIILMANLHAFLNKKGTEEQIKNMVKIYRKSFEAFGVNPEKAKFVLGSSFQLSKEYFKDLLRLSLKIRMLRAKRATSIIYREEDSYVSRFIYPLMQVLDMKYLNVDIAFGDLAQRKIHMLAREYLPYLNYKKPIAIHHEDIYGLQGGKMSSTQPETTIMINDKPEIIRKKILNAFCPPSKEKNPVLQICKYIIFNKNFNNKELLVKRKFGSDINFSSYRELENAFLKKQLHPLDLKKAVAEKLIKILEPAREKLKKF